MQPDGRSQSVHSRGTTITMKTLKNIFFHLTVLALVAGINFLILSFIPLVRESLAQYNGEKKNVQTLRIIQEYHQPKKKKLEPVKRKVRNVRAPRMHGAEKRMAMNFTPDLGVAGDDGVEVSQENFPATVFEENEADQNAVPLSQSAPEYPLYARQRNITGEVVVIFVVNEKGKVGSIDVVQSPAPILTASTKKAVKTWCFKPAVNKGIPVKMRFRIRIPFVLDSL